MPLRKDREMLVAAIRLKRYRNETHVKDMVKDILDAFSHKHHFPIGASQFSGPGICDRIACFNGYFVAVECKFGRNKLTDKQQAFLTNVANAGGLSFVADENNLIKLLECLEYVDGLPHAGDSKPTIPLIRVGLSIRGGTTNTFGENRASKRRIDGGRTPSHNRNYPT